MGRPKKEPTKVMRIPLRLVGAVEELIGRSPGSERLGAVATSPVVEARASRGVRLAAPAPEPSPQKSSEAPRMRDTVESDVKAAIIEAGEVSRASLTTPTAFLGCRECGGPYRHNGPAHQATPPRCSRWAIKEAI